MMARVFRAKKTSQAAKAFCFIAAVVVLVILVYAGIGGISAKQEEKQIQIAQDAIVKAAVQCYALESQFPPSLQYLEENYGITLDKKKYIYHYRTIGSNMVPEIKVFPNVGRGGGG